MTVLYDNIADLLRIASDHMERRHLQILLAGLRVLVLVRTLWPGKTISLEILRIFGWFFLVE